MFFRKKKVNSDDKSDLRHCESTSCPSPDTLYSIKECFNVDGKILCQFCYARLLAENVSEVTYENPKTKKVDKVELNRISLNTNTWQLDAQLNSYLSRIGPPSINERYIEEIKIWSDLLRSLKYEVDVNKFTKVPYSHKIRILETSQGLFYITLVSNHERLFIEEEKILLNAVLEIKTPKFNTFELSKISDAHISWMIDNNIISSEQNAKEQFLLITEVINGKLVPLEDYTTESKIENIQVFLHEFGRYFYFFNFIGCKAPIKIITLYDNETFSFLATNTDHSNESFSEVKSALRDIALTLPFLLDQNNLDIFLEGGAKQKKDIQDILLNNTKTKELILKFFNQFHIAFDEKKQLPSLDLFI